MLAIHHLPQVFDAPGVFANDKRGEIFNRARDRSMTHPKALRSLGAKWLKIIYRMWVERKPYDERLYIASLIQHHSSLVPYILKAQKEEHSKQKP